MESTMKITIVTIMTALFVTPSLADNKVIQGCEVKDMGGYFNKVNPTCVFSNESFNTNEPKIQKPKSEEPE